MWSTLYLAKYHSNTELICLVKQQVNQKASCRVGQSMYILHVLHIKNTLL